MLNDINANKMCPAMVNYVRWLVVAGWLPVGGQCAVVLFLLLSRTWKMGLDLRQSIQGAGSNITECQYNMVSIGV